MQNRPIVGALSLAEYLALSPSEVLRKQAEGWLLPIAGGAREEGGEGGGAGKEAAAEGGEGKEPKEEAGNKEGKPDEGETAEQKAARLEAENQRLSRKLSDKEKADRKAEQDRLKAEGKHEEAAKQAQKDADDARAELEQERRTNRGLRIAGELKFNNPSNALKLIDAEDLDDDAKAKKALEKLAKDEPGLLAEAARRRSAELGGGDPANADKNQQLRRMFGRGG